METAVNCSFTNKDLVSPQQVKWCPGCGDYVILNAVQSALPQLGVKREDIVFISGIGCSSRFPYYMNTYGFHTIHGRASAIATGVKLANPELSVWQITGDGDALAIGGNHFIHLLRRNVDINILLFNNRIYGLTKGQFSPTSLKGTVSKSSPQGTIEDPFTPGELALGAGCNFYARATDSNPKFLSELFVKAAKHSGTSLIEILQNCVIFNDGAYDAITAKENREETQLILEHGKPMLFGKEKNKGIRLNGLKPEVVEIGKDGIELKDILVHDATCSDKTMHNILVNFSLPEFPVALGIIRDVAKPTYEENMLEQISFARENSRYGNLKDFLSKGDTWEIKN